MATRLFIGSLSYSTTEESLRRAFEAYGQVTGVTIPRDRETQKSKGFAFVEMAVLDDAMRAMHRLTDSELDGRRIRVEQAKPKEGKSEGAGRGRW